MAQPIKSSGSDISGSDYSVGVFIGRFQPYHLGHDHIVRHALERFAEVIILIGSSFRAPDPKNPFTFEERAEMILSAIPDGSRDRVHCLPIMDALYDDTAWATQVRTAVKMKARDIVHDRGLQGVTVAPDGRVSAADGGQTLSISLTGYSKDASSYYLKMFPEWKSVGVAPYLTPEGKILSATGIRQALFTGTGALELEAIVPHGTLEFLADYQSKNERFERIAKETAFANEYQELVAKAEKTFNGWPIHIQTADAVVVQSGHVLLVERGPGTGQGLWALPGGHVDHDETLVDAMVRELYEECRLDMPKGALRGRVRTSKRYDNPERSLRGRVITEAFLVELPERASLEKVRGGDDAQRAFWLPIAEIDPRRMFEDHYDIIQDLLGLQQGYSNVYLPYLGL